MSETTRSSGADGPDAGSSRGKSKGQSVRSWCVYLATTAGLVCAVASWGVRGVVIGAVVVATATAVLVSSAWGADDRRPVSQIVRVTVAAGLITPAAVGLIAVFKFAGVLTVVILAATTPPVVALVRKRRDARDAREDRPVAPPEPMTPRAPAMSRDDGSAAGPSGELASLDDAALCWAWRRSFRLLEEAATAAERLAVVEQRQQYLDELNRRSPKGVAAWLAAGARASSNPLPYVDDARRRAN